MLKAALDAGLLPLLHKLLNCGAAAALHVGEAVLRLTPAGKDRNAVAKLLAGAHRCGPPLQELGEGWV
jgi:hypothetical protein